MPTDLDIYRAANLLIERYGEDAGIHAAMSADAMMAKGDLDGFAVWRLILKAVDELEANERPGSAKLH
jgi:hypothetical protein